MPTDHSIFKNICYFNVLKNICQVAIKELSFSNWGRIGFDVDMETRVAGRGAAGLVKSGNTVIANNDYEYAYAA